MVDYFVTQDEITFTPSKKEKEKRGGKKEKKKKPDEKLPFRCSKNVTCSTVHAPWFILTDWLAEIMQNPCRLP